MVMLKDHDSELEKNEVLEQQVEVTTLTAAQIQHRFSTLRGLDEDQMAALNRRVVRLVDWRMLPCITIMFLMKYDCFLAPAKRVMADFSQLP